VYKERTEKGKLKRGNFIKHKKPGTYKNWYPI